MKWFLGLLTALKGSKNKPWRHMCFPFDSKEEVRGGGKERKKHSL